MALTLILTRHAKSSWNDPECDDFDRPLNGRGRKSAPAVATWLAKKGYLPDLVLVSGARRTVETWEQMARLLPATTEMQSAPALYLAEPKVMIGVLQSQSARTLMMIGHNPGCALLALSLAEKPPDHPKFSQYPTAATTIFEFAADNWSDIETGSGRVLDFIVPGELIP